MNEEKIVLSGSLLPEIPCGKMSLLALNLMADEGSTWPLLDGGGTIYGMFVINSVSEMCTEFFADGSARKIDFTVNLTRVDKSLAAMFGDIQKQAESLVGKMQGRIGGLF